MIALSLSLSLSLTSFSISHSHLIFCFVSSLVNLKSQISHRLAFPRLSHQVLCVYEYVSDLLQLSKSDRFSVCGSSSKSDVNQIQVREIVFK